jgi:hypothetical protein
MDQNQMLNMLPGHAYTKIARSRQKHLPNPKTLVTLSNHHMRRREPTVVGASKAYKKALHLVSYTILDV